MNPTILGGVIGPGFLNQVPTLKPRKPRAPTPETSSPGSREPQAVKPLETLLGGSWAVISGVRSPRIWVISRVTLLITLLITTHEPPSRNVTPSNYPFVGFFDLAGHLELAMASVPSRAAATTVTADHANAIMLTFIRGIVKIRVLFWVPIIVRHLIFRVPKKGP